MERGRTRSEGETIAAFRFGYGFARGAPDAEAATPEGLIAGLVSPGASATLIPHPGIAERWPRIIEWRDARKAGDAELARIRDRLKDDFREESYALVEQRAWGASPFFERLTAFWLDHLAIHAQGLPQLFMAPAFEVEAIRPHVTGRFGDMLRAATAHPAMQRSLDQQVSVGPSSPAGQRSGHGLNENLARELLELHTLGVGGGYGQADVTNLALLLTGLSIDPETGRRSFQGGRAEPGAETVLGRSYGGARPGLADIEAALEDIAVHPDTARHVARKLAVHFVADDPDPGLVANVAEAFRRTGGALPAVYEALIEHPAGWAPEAAKVRRPEEYVAATIRALGLGGAARPDPRGRRRIVAEMARMGQRMFQPGGPDGFPELSADWITPQALAVRLRFASWAGTMLSRESAEDPRAFAREMLGARLSETTAWAVAAAPDRWEGFALALASPEFNRR